MKIFVTGGAGFIGSHFCDSALNLGHEVLAFDDLSTGHEYFLKDALKNKFFNLEEGDIRNFEQSSKALELFKPDWVVHFAANADVRRGTERPRRDLDYNTIARLASCKKFLFSSTGSVYGEPNVFPTPEDCPFPIQTSLYAASKLAGEALISSYSLGFNMWGTVFRFVSILGPRYTHGHIFDFLKQLKSNPSSLNVLGDGKQNKSYLHVFDLMDGLWKAIHNVEKVEVQKNPKGSFSVYNIGHDESLLVNESIQTISDHMKLNPSINYSGGTRGWIGDSPRIQLDTQKLKKLGWKAERDLKSSVRDTVTYLLENSHLLES
jgi:UDP-glucose 4-epimerase